MNNPIHPGTIHGPFWPEPVEVKRLYDPLLAMNTSKVDPLPHQIEAVYGYMLRLPGIRFLIADDPGAGKTIMAGLVIKENHTDSNSEVRLPRFF